MIPNKADGTRNNTAMTAMAPSRDSTQRGAGPCHGEIATLLHMPCLSVPGATGINGLPMGLQVIAPIGEDALCLRAGSVLESSPRP